MCEVVDFGKMYYDLCILMAITMVCFCSLGTLEVFVAYGDLLVQTSLFGLATNAIWRGCGAIIAQHIANQ
ncbi:hypothetical protein BU24DRAFT_85563 [Aaosphaeria arxii CBS 175.79]|uniref:Uncharacterized protein n=1 Tax=Aaosphaeria arxii CBS 175.79 TaxID=1450172 RepID=A0A6A5X8H0_9PLEO|nr:uncharacterized protein BU24DRAFT_85563 [Aaosphaeria arxii CBS 175.79]KAF2009242.1 hypothetical protein BU24DRAFT_85563 [Aaosphaeria arxii CBS 175.79]